MSDIRPPVFTPNEFISKAELKTLLSRYLYIEVDLNPFPTSSEYLSCNVKIYFDGTIVAEATGTTEKS